MTDFDKPSIAEMQRREIEAYAECPRVWIDEHEDDDGSPCFCPKRWCDMDQIDCRVCAYLKEQNRDRADIKLWRAAQGDRLAITAPVLIEIAAAALAYENAQCDSPHCDHPAHRGECAILKAGRRMSDALAKVRP